MNILNLLAKQKHKTKRKKNRNLDAQVTISGISTDQTRTKRNFKFPRHKRTREQSTHRSPNRILLMLIIEILTVGGTSAMLLAQNVIFYFLIFRSFILFWSAIIWCLACASCKPRIELWNSNQIWFSHLFFIFNHSESRLSSRRKVSRSNINHYIQKSTALIELTDLL